MRLNDFDYYSASAWIKTRGLAITPSVLRQEFAEYQRGAVARWWVVLGFESFLRCRADGTVTVR
jgi:hypothetical protein